MGCFGEAAMGSCNSSDNVELNLKENCKSKGKRTVVEARSIMSLSSGVC